MDTAEDRIGTLIDDVASNHSPVDGASSSPGASEESDLMSTLDVGGRIIDGLAEKNFEKDDGDDDGTDEKQGSGEGEGDGDGANGAESKNAAGQEKPKEEDPGNVEDDGKLAPFHKHPRFQQVISENNDLKSSLAELRGEMNAMRAMVAGNKSGGEGKGDGALDLTNMEPEDILDLMNTDPRKYSQMVIEQAKRDLGASFKQERNQEDMQTRVTATFDAFASDHPDFDEKWERGEIQEFMKQHPGHNAMSAFLTMSAAESAGDMDKKIQAAVDDAVKKAVADTEARMNEQFKLKRGAGGLGKGPSGGAGALHASKTPPELQNTEKHGGLGAVLAQRLAARRRAQAGAA